MPGFSARGIGELDPSFAPKSGITAQTAVTADGKILALGDYVDGPDGLGVALVRLNADGTTDSSFTPPFDEFNANFRRFRLDSQGRIIVGGGIKVGTATAATFNRLLPSGRVDSSFKLTVEGQPNNFVVQSDDRFIFNSRPITQIPGYITLFTRVNGDGSPDTAYLTDSSTVSAVTSDIALQADGKLVILGYISNFSPAVGFTNRLLARLNANGTTDDSLRGDKALEIGKASADKLAIQPDGKFLVSGAINASDFSHIDAFLKRYNSDGSLDGTFTPPTFAPGQFNIFSRVQAIKVQGNGKIIIGGVFSAVNGVARTNIARLNSDGSVDETFQSPAEFVGGAALQVIWLDLQPDGNLLVSGKLYAPAAGTSDAAVFGLVRLINDGGTTNPPPVGKTTDLQASLDGITVKAKAKKTLLRTNLTLRNAGKKKSKGITASAYLSDNNTFEAGQDTLLRDIDLVSLGFGKLGKNAASSPIPLQFKVRGAVAANLSGKYLLLVVDPANTIAESDETNNVAAAGPLP